METESEAPRLQKGRDRDAGTKRRERHTQKKREREEIRASLKQLEDLLAHFRIELKSLLSHYTLSPTINGCPFFHSHTQRVPKNLQQGLGGTLLTHSTHPLLKYRDQTLINDMYPKLLHISYIAHDPIDIIHAPE